MKFDAIFSFQDDAEQLPYKDKFLGKIKKIVADEPKLSAYLENLYGAEDSKFNLYNCTATAGFLTEYIKTDPKLDEIRAKYEGKLKFKKKEEMRMDQAFKIKTRNENFEVNFNKLDDSQRAAVEALGNNVVIRASAGSGKTSTLITAIAAYRYERLNDRICAITYTRAARAEMEERLHTMGIFDVEVTTIHV